MVLPRQTLEFSGVASRRSPSFAGLRALPSARSSSCGHECVSSRGRVASLKSFSAVCVPPAALGAALFAVALRVQLRRLAGRPCCPSCRPLRGILADGAFTRRVSQQQLWDVLGDRVSVANVTTAGTDPHSLTHMGHVVWT